MRLKPFNEYDQIVMNEIAEHIVSPNAVQVMLSMAGKPIEKVMKSSAKIPYLRKVNQTISKGIHRGLNSVIDIAGETYSEKDILDEYADISQITTYDEVKQASLLLKDKVADSYSLSNAAIVGAEGAVMGVATSICEFIPGAQLAVPAIIMADVAASMTFLSRHTSLVAASYGYSPKDPQNIPHVIASMVPQTESDDEGFFTAKGIASMEIREASRFFARYTGKGIEELLAKGEAPGLIKLINHVAARLEVIITEKELGMLVPIAGAILNSSVNIAFQQVGHISSKDYFRRLILNEQYGEAVVNDNITRLIVEKKANDSA